MPRKVKNGWTAQIFDSRGFTVDGETPTGIYAHTDNRSKVWLDLAGLKSARGETFEMPADPATLRDLAEALGAIAKDIEDSHRKRTSGGR